MVMALTFKHVLPCAVLLALPLAWAGAPPSDGLADLEGRADEVVHVNLNSATLQALSRMAATDTGEDAQLFQALAGVSGIKVVSLEFHGEGMPPREDLDAVRASVVPDGWTRFLSTHSTEPEESVDGYAGADGMAIVTAERGQIAAVQIDGVFSAGAIPLLSHRFGLPAMVAKDAPRAFAIRGGPVAAAAVHPEKLDFKRMVREIERQENIHHLRIPLMGLVKPAAFMASGGRAGALDLAVFENAPAGFVDAAGRVVPEGWSRFVEVRDGKGSTNIYVGAVEQRMPLLIAAWDGDGVLLTVKVSLKDLCKSPMAWAESGRRQHED
jgi:hypothetical protein